MSWLNALLPPKFKKKVGNRNIVPSGLWISCSSCSSTLYEPDFKSAMRVCSKCGYHAQLSVRERLKHFLDPDTPVEEIAATFVSNEKAGFKDSKKYKDRLQQARRKSGETEAMVVQYGKLYGSDVVVAVFDFSFMGGSMGSTVGERFVAAVDKAIDSSAPLVCFCASGGARMQEGILSLMQMAKTSVATVRLREHGLPYIVVLTNPTMGGVSASLAMQGDIILAEPGALVGFAGPRVIKQTVRQELPEGFQLSETVLKTGNIDNIVDRSSQRLRIANMLSLLRQTPAPSGDIVSGDSTGDTTALPAIAK